jgi:hypothetical protein
MVKHAPARPVDDLLVDDLAGVGRAEDRTVLACALRQLHCDATVDGISNAAYLRWSAQRAHLHQARRNAPSAGDSCQLH